MRRKPLEHRFARGGVEHAETEARQHEAGEERAEAAGQRGDEHEDADDGLADAERDAHAEPIGEPARRQRHQHAAQVDGGQQEPDLRAAQVQRVQQER